MSMSNATVTTHIALSPAQVTTVVAALGDSVVSFGSRSVTVEGDVSSVRRALVEARDRTLFHSDRLILNRVISKLAAAPVAIDHERGEVF